MNIDKRWVELLADVAPVKMNKWYNRLGIFAMIGFLIGFIVLMNGLFRPVNNAIEVSQAVTIFWRGVGIIGASLLVIGFLSILKNKQRKKNREAFIKYYDENNTFPTWPEDEKPRQKARTV